MIQECFHEERDVKVKVIQTLSGDLILQLLHPDSPTVTTLNIFIKDDEDTAIATLFANFAKCVMECAKQMVTQARATLHPEPDTPGDNPPPHADMHDEHMEQAVEREGVENGETA